MNKKNSFSKKENPSKKPYFVRRSEILEHISNAGTTNIITQKKLAKKYGVSQAQISKDIAHIKNKFLKKDESSMGFTIHLLYQKLMIIAATAENVDDAVRAVKVVESYNRFLFDIGILKKVNPNDSINQIPKRKSMAEIFEEVQKEEEEERKKNIDTNSPTTNLE